MATSILLIKTGALGDVLRTTSILPGLAAQAGGTRVVWVTAPGAAPLLEGLVADAERPGLIAELVSVDPADGPAIAALGEILAGQRFDRILSFDDEPDLCALASRVAAGSGAPILGAQLGPDGQRTYGPDAGPWFDMGLLSRFGKAAADQLKIDNRRSHPELFAEMVGVPVGEPQLVLPSAALTAARERRDAAASDTGGLQIGLNTGAGGRWVSKALPEERVVALARELRRRLTASHAEPVFVLLGGPGEEQRNQRLASALRAEPGLVLRVTGCDNGLIDFAALVDGLDLIVTSDSLALHIATARRVPTVAFFAPTSAAEIELYGRGLKVASTAPDYCSYRPDVDTTSLTVERLADAVEAVLAGLS